MKIFRITIEEHISETFEIEANDLEEAMQTAEEQYWNQEFIIGPNVTARLMSAEDENGDCTEWVEF